MNHTPGKWQLQFAHGVCIGIGAEIQPGYSQMIVNTILPDTDEEYAKELPEILANAKLMAAAPRLLKALQMIKDTTTELNVLNITLAALQTID